MQVYDNGAATFFKFPEGLAPRVYGVNPEGYEYPLPTRRQGEFLVVDLVYLVKMVKLPMNSLDYFLVSTLSLSIHQFSKTRRIEHSETTQYY